MPAETAEAAIVAPAAIALPTPDRLSPHKVGMVCFLVSEAAFFGTLIMAYLIYLRHAGPPPTPRDTLTLKLVLLNTACLLLSSLTLHFAQRALRSRRTETFRLLWAATIVLGLLFLTGTGVEWQGRIREHGLTIGVNLFGTTYYTLVGFHAFHVTLGVLALSAVLGLSLAGQLGQREPLPITLVGWYWHFVDVVWVVVFFVVYIFGR